MICHPHKCIFIHQRKCAGLSVMKAFGLSRAEDSNAEVEWHYLNDGVLCPEFASAPEDYLKFAVVRNPWDRFVSGWLFCDETKRLSILDVLRNLPDSGWAHEHVTRQQTTTLCHPDDRFAVDRLIRFEHLQRDFDRVCDLIGKPRTVVPHLNAVWSRMAYTTYFNDPEARRLFEQHYERDLCLLDYQYGDP